MEIPGLFLILLGAALSAQPPRVSESTQSFRPTGPDTPRAAATPAQLSHEARGDIFMARKMYREAIEVYRQGPDDSAILQNKIGIAYHQMMDLNGARKQYEKAARMSPRYSEAINNLGTVYYARKNHKRAIAYYKKALEVAPNSASIHSNLGTAYFARKKYEDALNSYQKALELDPEVFEHRGSNGVMLQERSVTEKAKFHFFLSKSYAKAGNIERSLLYMRMSLEEGFKDRHLYREAPEFSKLQELPEFKEIIGKEYRVL